MSGHDLAREPGLGEQRDHRLGEMPLPVQPAQPLIGAKRLRDGPSSSHSVDSPTAAPPLKRVRWKRDRDTDLGDDRVVGEERKGSERAVCQTAGIQGNSSRKGRMEEEFRRSASCLQRRRNKTPEGAVYGEDEPSVTGGSGDDELLGGIQRHTSQDEGTGAVRTETA